MSGFDLLKRKYVVVTGVVLLCNFIGINSALCETDWEYKYFPNNKNSTTVKIMKDGNSACASYNARDCIWDATKNGINFSRLNPLICPKDAYYPGHWCYEAGKDIPGSVAFAAAKAVRQEEERQRDQQRLAQEAEEKRFKSLLNDADPQKLYLAAGAASRNGDSYKAKQIYETIINRFPDSPFAVKANDQLLSNIRADDMRSTANQADRDARHRAYLQCKEEVNACYLRNKGSNINCYRECDNLR